MKDISAALQTHLQGELTSLASCWQLTRTDGAAFYFTDHDQDLNVAGALYLASEGYDRSALKGTSGLEADEMDLSGNLHSDHLSDEALRAGLFDFAEVTFFVVNWQDTGAGILPLRKGWVGEVSWAEGRFIAELRGLSNALQRQIGAVYTPECQADLGDERCKIDLEILAMADVVANVSDHQVFSLTQYSGEDGELNGGILQFTSGDNLDRSFEIQTWVKSGKILTLFLKLPRAPHVGDTVMLYPGCDKRFTTCKNTYSNHINFQGFPHIPGTDTLAEIPYD